MPQKYDPASEAKQINTLVEKISHLNLKLEATQKRYRIITRSLTQRSSNNQALDTARELAKQEQTRLLATMSKLQDELEDTHSKLDALSPSDNITKSLSLLESLDPATRKLYLEKISSITPDSK